MGDNSEYPKAYLLDDENVIVEAAHLKRLGVLAWKCDADNWEKEGKLAGIRAQRNYKNHDFVLSKNIPNLKEKLDTFKTEHLHYDEEIRFMIDGGGYFDIKDEQDRWVRIVTLKGQMIVIPAGAFHRFMPDANVYFHTMRLFQEEPVWTAYNRGLKEADLSAAREEYVKQFLVPIVGEEAAEVLKRQKK